MTARVLASKSHVHSFNCYLTFITKIREFVFPYYLELMYGDPHTSGLLYICNLPEVQRSFLSILWFLFYYSFLYIKIMINNIRIQNIYINSLNDLLHFSG